MLKKLKTAVAIGAFVVAVLATEAFLTYKDWKAGKL